MRKPDTEQVIDFAVKASLVVVAALWFLFLAGCSKPKWDETTKASCWDGPGAEKRMMNMLSPHFSGGKFDDYLKWQTKTRGANTCHVFVCNKADGEGGGYSIYGNKPTIDWIIDKKYVDTMLKRIKAIRSARMAVVVWLMADDSTAWNRTLLSDPDRYLRDLDKEGLLDDASIVVVGLELTEYANAAQVERLVAATRKVYKGKVGVHHNSRRLDFAHLADILFYQIEPGASPAKVAEETRRALATGKPVNFFELSRNPNRPLCEAALGAGAFGVGNW